MLHKIRNNKKGFTLIELMVVIAIIAILATVVLVALQSARTAAYDARKKSAVAQLRSLAETYYAQDQNYLGLAADPETAALDAVEDVSYFVNVAGTTWCAIADLEAVGEYFCADNDSSPAVGTGGCTAADATSCTY